MFARPGTPSDSWQIEIGVCNANAKPVPTCLASRLLEFTAQSDTDTSEGFISIIPIKPEAATISTDPKCLH